MTTDELIEDVITREGGFVDHKADRGSATKFGITKGTLARWRDRHVTVADVRALDIDEARDIYRSEYVIGPGFSDIPDPLRVQLVDFGVHSGPAQAVRALQRVLGVRDDGVLGPKTRAALAGRDVAVLARGVWQARVRYLMHVCVVKPTNAGPFVDGWCNRLFELQP